MDKFASDPYYSQVLSKVSFDLGQSGCDVGAGRNPQPPVYGKPASMSRCLSFPRYTCLGLGYADR